MDYTFFHPNPYMVTRQISESYPQDLGIFPPLVPKLLLGDAYGRQAPLGDRYFPYITSGSKAELSKTNEFPSWSLGTRGEKTRPLLTGLEIELG
jgi:hypothetical protein